MSPSSRIGKGCFLLMQILVGAVLLCPILYALDMSLLPLSQIFSKPLDLIPKRLNFSYYSTAFQRAPLLRYLTNTVIIAVCITFGQVFLACITAFSFAYFDFKGKPLLFMMILATMMIPGESIVLSNYLTMGELGLLDTYTAMVLPSLASATTIFLCVRHFYRRLRNCMRLRPWRDAAACVSCCPYRFRCQKGLWGPSGFIPLSTHGMHICGRCLLRIRIKCVPYRLA